MTFDFMRSRSISKPTIFVLTLLFVASIGALTASAASEKKELPSDAAANASKGTSENSSSELTDRFPADLLQISNTLAFSKYVFLVDKQERKLFVYEHSGETIRKIDEVPADIGKNGGNKTKRDDKATPEGIYFFQKKLFPPEIPFNTYGRMAITMDYPNLFDQRENKTGHGIWLHSIPDTVPLTRGSRGCVVIRNEMIQKISDYIKLGETPMIIYDHINYVSKDEHDQRRSEMTAFLKSWKDSWESMDIDKYMSFYGEDFKTAGFNSYNAWKNHKLKLKNKYEYIKIELSQPFVLIHKDQLIIKTLQKYTSNQHTDYGVKVLHALKRNGKYQIIREDWSPAKEDGTLTANF